MLRRPVSTTPRQQILTYSIKAPKTDQEYEADLYKCSCIFFECKPYLLRFE